MTVYSRFEMDSSTAYRLKVAWSTAVASLALANDCAPSTIAYRAASQEAHKALDHYFSDVEVAIKA